MTLCSARTMELSVLSASILTLQRENLLRWHGSFDGKKRKLFGVYGR